MALQRVHMKSCLMSLFLRSDTTLGLRMGLRLGLGLELGPVTYQPSDPSDQ